jgi:DedD protein
MTEKSEAQEGENNSAEMRGKLIKRLAVAGVLVASLLGMLAFFDYLATAPEESEAPVFPHPVPVAPRNEVSQPVTPLVDSPAPAAVSEPVVEAPPAPVIEAQPSLVLEVEPKAHRENRPLAPSTAAIARKPAAASATPDVGLARSPRAVPEATAWPTIEPQEQVSPPRLAAKSNTRVLEPQPASPPVVLTPQRLFSGFLVQAGVFTSPELAEELHAKLTLSGISSTLETRVQIGPFRTRQEAELAQQKLRELGVESVLLPPKGARR